MSEIKVDEITKGMSKVNISDGKKAIVTIGRWQPPHAGHSNLIKTVINDVDRDIKINSRDTKGFVYVSPRPDESRGGIGPFLLELREKYGDSDSLDQMHIKRYLASRKNK